MSHFNSPIGVFDSGIGGLSILRALREQLHSEDFVYFADTTHNPYGEKSEAFIQERSLAIARALIEAHGIKALVVACNTATAAAIHRLREAWPELPIIGVEPALKPAAQLTKTGKVGVLATRGTLQSAKFAALKESLAGQAEFICVAAEGLAEGVERLSLQADMPLQNATDLIAVSARSTGEIGVFGHEKGQVDTLVLGCTHYPLVRELFEEILQGRAQIVDNAQPVALRTQQLIAPFAAQTGRVGAITWETSGSLADLQAAARRWLGKSHLPECA